MLEERARRDPQGLALDDGERRRSWAELDDRVRRSARLLREDLRLRPGDHVAALLAHGAEVNPIIEGLDAPLHWAALSGHEDVVEMLLDHGADVNAKRSNGETPLIMAASEGG